MRRIRRERPLVPYFAALLFSYAVSLVFAVISAVLLWLIDGMAATGAFAVVIIAMGSFVCGRIGGALKGANGLRVGFVCGIMFFLPLLILALIFGVLGGVMVLVKLAVCIAFSAAGGVVGVNSRQ